MIITVDQLMQRLQTALGSAAVSADTNALTSHRIDGITPHLVVTPASADQVGAMLRACSEAGATVIPWGGGTAMALGNHELSLSAAQLAALLDHATFPVLAADLEAKQASPLAGRVGSSALISAQGLKLGVVGVANPSSPPNLPSAGNPWGLVVAADLAAAVQAAIDEVLPRADLIVVLSHLGLDGDRELVQATSGVDLLLGGHQHIVTGAPERQDDGRGETDLLRPTPRSRCASAVASSGAPGG